MKARAMRGGVGTVKQLPDSRSAVVTRPLQRHAVPCRMSAALIALLSVSGCSGGVLDAQGPIGAADAKILLNAVGIMLAIVVPTIIAILAFGWWFRASNTRARYRPEFVYSGGIEVVVWGIPTLVIMFLGGVIWIGSHDLDPFKPISSADKPGEYDGQSAQFSGDGFSNMNFILRADPQDGFAQRIATARQSGSALHRTSYLALCQQSSNVRPFTYRTVDASLFNAVVNQQLPPCPGPNIEGPGATVRPRLER